MGKTMGKRTWLRPPRHGATKRETEGLGLSRGLGLGSYERGRRKEMEERKTIGKRDRFRWEIAFGEL